MLADTFKRHNFIYEYFETLLNMVQSGERSFPQSLIFEGMDTKESLLFSLELARILNCGLVKDVNCSCPSCRWIREYAHPSTIFVTQSHFKPDDDTTKTTISVKQIREIEKSLVLSSDYHRFFIFFSSTPQEETNDINYSYLSYKPYDFSIEPLDTKIMSSVVSNALLKSLEEPPKNTTFVFLAKSSSDLISTIVSRSQVFKIGGQKPKYDYLEIKPFVSQYPNITYLNAFDLAESVLKSPDITKTLNTMISYLKDTMAQNPENQTILSHIKIIKDTQDHLRANVSPKNAIEAMYLRIVRGY